jgi:hypothetical protein
MKPKFLLLAIGFLSFAAANATTDPEPCPDRTKVNEVTGIILHSENKKPLKDVSITAYSTSTKRTILTTDAGNYAFDELKPGTYRFVFEKAGFKRVTKEKVVIKTDETFQLNIEMIESKDLDLMPSPFHVNDL